MPLVSVIVATWNRGPHIVPTLQSALSQSFQDFEIIVVGDGCTDDTGTHITPFLSERVQWVNLPRNTGSQSFPNNFGLAKAKGQLIAYLGHDDIWDKRHLEVLVEEFSRDPKLGVATSGILVWGPLGSDYFIVYGLIGSDSDKFTYPLVPSAVMHTREAARRINGWRSPVKSSAPVDQDFFLRAAQSGAKFCSTGRITAHKLSTSYRYLFYALPQSSSDQSYLVDLLSLPECDVKIAEFVERSKALNLFMSARHADYSRFAPGQLHLESRARRGLRSPALQVLGKGQTIPKSDEDRALDWLPSWSKQPFRLSGPNPKPKLLIPFTSDGRALFELFIVHITEASRNALAVRVNGMDVPCLFKSFGPRKHKLMFESRLLQNAPSIVELTAPLGDHNGMRFGLALGDIRLTPVPEDAPSFQAFIDTFQASSVPTSRKP